MDAKVVSRLIPYLKDWLSFRYEQSDLPGFSVAIAWRGEVIFHAAYGFADLEKEEKLTTDHLFRVASHSKTFAGTALMQLYEQGKFNIDEPVVKHLPWLAAHKDKRMAKITTRQLLSHSAGMIRDGLDADCWQFEKPFPDEEELKRELLKADLIFDCNTTMKYSNYGYGLLGLVVEAVSGQSFRQYAQEHIIAKLNLQNTGPEYVDSIASRLVTGYTRVEGKLGRLPLTGKIDTAALSAATGFYSTAADLATYFSAHFVGSGKLLSDESKKEMQRTQWPVTLSAFNQEYGLGLQIDYVGKRRVIGHAGGFPGMATRSLAHAQAGLAVSVLTNCIDADPTAIARAIYDYIDFFEGACAKDPDKYDALAKFEGRFISLFRTMDVLCDGDKLIGISPSSWQPFADVEELIAEDGETLRMNRANGFSFAGEILRYKFDGKGKVEMVNLGGFSLYPPAEHVKRLSRFESHCLT